MKILWDLNELNSFLESDGEFAHVRFGKLELDRGGLAAFKKENAWIAGIDDLPYNVIYVGGERKKEFVGSGVDRLVNRMRRLVLAEGADPGPNGELPATDRDRPTGTG